MRWSLEVAKEVLPKVTVRAYGELMGIYADAVSRSIFSEDGSKKEESARGWKKVPADKINLINVAEVVLETIIREDSELLRFCSDCHIIYIKQDDEESRNRFEGLDHPKKRVLLALVYALSSIFRRHPIKIPALTMNGVDLGGGFCPFCNRINTWGRRIREVQKKESPWDCFGTSFDHCSEMDRCDYQHWDRENWRDPRKRMLPKTECVIRSEYLALDENKILGCSLNWWVWASRVATLTEQGRYRFSIRRNRFDC